MSQKLLFVWVFIWAPINLLLFLQIPYEAFRAWMGIAFIYWMFLPVFYKVFCLDRDKS